MTYLKQLTDFFHINCNHRKAVFDNCKYCPDCGKKIVSKWVIIRCEFCGHYRKALIDGISRIKPKAKYCFYCGSNKWRSQNYYKENIPDSLKKLSVRKIETEMFKFGSLTERTKVWISINGLKK